MQRYIARDALYFAFAYPLELDAAASRLRSASVCESWLLGVGRRYLIDDSFVRTHVMEAALDAIRSTFPALDGWPTALGGYIYICKKKEGRHN